MMSAFLFAHLLYILQVSEIKIGFRCRSLWSGLEAPTELDRFGSEVVGNIPSIVLMSNGTTWLCGRIWHYWKTDASHKVGI